MQEKALIRKAAARTRAGIEDRPRRSEQIWAFLLSLPEFVHAQGIFAYAAKEVEPATLPFLQKVSLDGKLVALPVVSGPDLEFFRVVDFDALEADRFGVLTPDPGSRKNPENLFFPRPGDAILVPGLAFARNGARLGHGAGYYDRYLSRVPSGVIKIGLAFSEQVQRTLPEESFDVRMDFVLSDREVIQAHPR